MKGVVPIDAPPPPHLMETSHERCWKFWTVWNITGVSWISLAAAMTRAIRSSRWIRRCRRKEIFQNESINVRSGDRAVQSTGPLLPINRWPNAALNGLCTKRMKWTEATSCWYPGKGCVPEVAAFPLQSQWKRVRWPIILVTKILYLVKYVSTRKNKDVRKLVSAACFCRYHCEKARRCLNPNSTSNWARCNDTEACHCSSDSSTRC